MNASTTQFAPEPTLFEARLHPHRSLSADGLRRVMARARGRELHGGHRFSDDGRWPVFGFLGLDVLLVYLAFRANFRAARAYEDIRVTPSVLAVRQVSARGDAREERFNPRWVRLETARDDDYGMMRLALVSRGVPLVIGAFLGPRQREQVAHGLAGALATAKR